ncbi:MAG TPA: PIN domain-containing protein [Bryobacteraceae bacterium]|jgi:predicted nucleic acid-binding protein|nr:PIN domain-containing protein [Bryobacteraceae bacterium]
MNDRNQLPFFDTNILIYTLAQDDSRASIARNLLKCGGIISVQVLNEFVTAARRKLKLSWNEIHEALGSIREFCLTPAPITIATHERALQIAQRDGYSFYDSLVIAAALENSCDKLYTEDLRDGQVIEGLSVRNPFRTSV